VNWQVKNYFNDVKNVKVKAVLPAGVSLTGQTYPESQLQNFSMDSNSKEIVWSVGDLVAGAGINSSGPSVSFQISFTPNLSQRQSVPSLVGSATISGDDQFSGNTIRNGVPAIDTSLPNDQANSGKGTVQ
jgi:hypothetical protein